MPHKVQQFRPDFLPWNVSDTYWIIIENSELSDDIVNQLELDNVEGNIFALKCENSWVDKWNKIEETINQSNFTTTTLAALISERKLPDIKELQHELRPINYLSTIAKNAWLGEALLDNRVVIFLQPVVDSQSNIYGYEAFVRAINKNGSEVSGWEIIKASCEMRIEFRLDRFLHGKAIEALVQGGYEGTLFVNFLPGFIQKPDVYLEGLTREAQLQRVNPNRISLDLTKDDIPRNYMHLIAIKDYCRQQGHHISLENVLSPELAKKIFGDLQPTFFKLDRDATKTVVTPEGKKNIKQLVRLAHANDIKVLAIGVEDAEMLDALKELNVDLFQGYHIGHPKQAVLN